jgi:enoyl-CoA hydratase/carnithine racemase
MDFETLRLERADGYAIVSLDRPPVNAVNHVMRRDLRDCFNMLGEERQLNSIILAARADSVFCGGVDLKEKVAAPQRNDLRSVLDPFWHWRAAQSAIRNCVVPVIAAVEGKVIGAGFGLVGVCDLVIAGEKATFALTEINVGLLGGASKALRLLGPSKARRMLFFGEYLPAAELYRVGGIEEVVPAGEALARAVELARILAEKSPIALRLAKESILRIETDAMMDDYRTENDYTNRLAAFEDAREAMTAFVEKRSPNWNWR